MRCRAKEWTAGCSSQRTPQVCGGMCMCVCERGAPATLCAPALSRPGPPVRGPDTRRPASPSAGTAIAGKIRGLPPGQHGLRVHMVSPRPRPTRRARLHHTRLPPGERAHEGASVHHKQLTRHARAQLGDLSNVPASCGPVFDPVRGKRPDHDRQAGDLGTITAGSDGVAGRYTSKCMMHAWVGECSP